jgi:hypothetical protein
LYFDKISNDIICFLQKIIQKKLDKTKLSAYNINRNIRKKRIKEVIIVYCTNCCKEYNEKMKFCVICGQALTPKAEVGADSIRPQITEQSDPPEKPAPVEIPAPAPAENPAPVIDEQDTFSEDNDDDDDTEIVEITKKPKIKMFRNIPIAILSALIGVLLFSLILCGGLSAVLRYASSPENIKGMVESIDFLALPAPPEISEIMNVDTNSLGDAVYTFAEPTGLTRDDIDYIYENSTFRDGLASILTGYAQFLREGVVPPDLTTDDIKALFDDNLKVMNEAFGQDISKRNLEVAYANIELSEEFLSEIDIHSLTSGSDKTVNVVRSLISYPAFIAEAAIILLLMILISRINKKTAPALMVTGVAGVTAAVLTAIAMALFSNGIIGLAEPQKSVIAGALTFIAPVVYISAAAAAFIGIIFIVIARAKRGSPRGQVAD